MNRLKDARSAYLRSAAHQPVAWWPWCPEAFDEARKRNVPILLDIGAVWCHWCHVIDHESYDDPALAELINRHFIAVKVDRDERPDVDARYQLAVQALTGQGGWPLTAFLTPEGKVFFGGTYFPPDGKYGRPGFRSVLEKVADHYAKQKEDVLAQAEHLHHELARHAARTQPGDLQPAMLEAADRTLVQHSDPVNGGFGGAPKFPHPAAVELAMARSWWQGDRALRAVAEGALDGMARGGVRDHLGGGFHRYSVDAEWVVPHFEKMLYDNAGLLRNYAQAWALWGNPLHREAAHGIADWVLGILQDRRGGFGGSQDADVGPTDDGDHWTWTLDELRAAVPDPGLQDLLRAHFDIHERGEMHHDPRRNVLFIAVPVERIARECGLPPAMVGTRLAEGKRALLEARAQRTAPVVDRVVYAGWNGMAVSALLEGWKALGPEAEPWREASLRALDRILSEAWDRERGVAHALHEDGTATLHGLLEDQVWVAQASLDAFEATGHARYLEAARALLDLVLDRFRDPADGALRDVAPELRDPPGGGVEAAPLSAPRKPIEDAPHASANGQAALALLQAHALTGEARYREAAQRLLRAFAGAAPRMGLFAATWHLALARLLEPATQVVVAAPPGGEAAPEAVALHRAAVAAFHPWRVVVPPNAISGDPGRVPEAARAALESGVAREGAVALVCRGTRCEAPVRDPAALQAALGRGTR